MRFCLAVLVLSAISSAATGCASHGGNATLLSIALDTHGASNTACTLTVANIDRRVDVQIGAPDPPGPDTSLAPLAPAVTCWHGVAGVTVLATSSPAVAIEATRTPTALCAGSHDPELIRQLGFSPNDVRCSVTVTLTCGGVVLYDRIPWTACAWFG